MNLVQLKRYNTVMAEYPDNLTEEEMDLIDAKHGAKVDVIKAAITMIEAINLMGIEDTYAAAIFGLGDLGHSERNHLFKGFVHASGLMSKQEGDLRNSDSITFFKKLLVADYSQTLADVELPKTAYNQSHVMPEKLGGITQKITSFTEQITNYEKKYGLSDSEYGQILGTALTQTHRTLQQLFVKAMVAAINKAASEYKKHGGNESKEIISIYAVVCSNNQSFAYV